MSSDVSLIVNHLGKVFRLYQKPIDRLWAGLGLLRNPVKSFTGLADVSFSLKKGEVLGVVGRNGSGKSTLLQLICGTLRPTSGSVNATGRIAALLELGAGFNTEFSGAENVRLSAALMGLSPDEINQKFNDIVAFAELQAFIDQPVKTYSSGMFVRLAFAVATSVEPDILVIDEALSVGDGVFARKSFDRIMSLKAKGTTILFCSHALYQVEALCDRAIWLKDGHVAMLGDGPSVIVAYQQFLTQTSLEQVNAQTSGEPAEPTRSDHSPYVQQVTVRKMGEDIHRETPVTVFSSTVDTAWIDIDVVQSPVLPPPTVAVLITNAAGIQVCSFSTHIDSSPLTAEQRFVRLELPEIALLKGDYDVDVFLLCENGIHVYEHVRQAARLKVIQNHLEVGLVHLPRRWSVPNPAQVLQHSEHGYSH